MATAIYPGSFDPVTRGHLDIIKRAAKVNEHLIVAVLINSAKHPLFTVEERVELLRECCKNIPNVSVESFDGLTVEFAKKRHATVMVRGLRAVTDFENEIQLAQTNHALMPGPASRRCSWRPASSGATFPPPSSRRPPATAATSASLSHPMWSVPSGQSSTPFGRRTKHNPQNPAKCLVHFNRTPKHPTYTQHKTKTGGYLP